jgi:drug/metabolite transporter (DMT)-like permease
MDFIINSYIWVPIVLIQTLVASYLSIKASTSGSNHILMAVWLVGIIPTWTAVTAYSKNIALHGFIFDFVHAVGWSASVVIFQNKSFTIYQYLGMTFMVAGLMLFKKQ